MEHTYRLDLSLDAIKLLYKSVDFHHNWWSGGDPFEQQELLYLKNELYKCVLEFTFQQDA